LKFTRDQLSAVTIRHVDSGAIKVGDEVLKDSFALSPDEIIRDWQATRIDQLCEDDFGQLLAANPEMILLGTGAKPEFPPRELVFSLARRGIGLEVMDTAAACRTFNILVGDGRKVAAIFIVEK
jgi:uncharacterized protein